MFKHQIYIKFLFAHIYIVTLFCLLMQAGLVQKLSTVFCETLHLLKSALLERKSTISFPIFCELKTHLKLSHDAIITIVHNLFRMCLFDPILKAEKDKCENKSALAEKYFEVRITDLYKYILGQMCLSYV